MAKQTRLYALFEKVDGKWIRLSGSAYRKDVAVRVFQTMLLGLTFAGRHPELRVVDGSVPWTDGSVPWTDGGPKMEKD